MQAFEDDGVCPQCSTRFLDAGDEMVCPSCGIVGDKEVAAFRRGQAPRASDFTPQALGSYLGSADPTARERFSRGFSGSRSTYAYLKTVSDFIGRNDGTLFECVRMVERVSERLGLTNVVMTRAVTIARRMLQSKRGGRRTTIAAISAFAIIASSRIGGGRSVAIREVIEAHRALGRNLRTASIIQLSLDSDVRIQPRSPEDYVNKVVARLAIRMKASQLQSSPLNLAAELQGLRDTAADILRMVPEESKAGHRPSALAATAVYAAEFVLAVREGRPRMVTQRDVGECGDAAEYTIREQFREIMLPAIRRSGLAGSSTAPIAR